MGVVAEHGCDQGDDCYRPYLGNRGPSPWECSHAGCYVSGEEHDILSVTWESERLTWVSHPGRLGLTLADPLGPYFLLQLSSQGYYFPGGLVYAWGTWLCQCLGCKHHAELPIPSSVWLKSWGSKVEVQSSWLEPVDDTAQIDRGQ